MRLVDLRYRENPVLEWEEHDGEEEPIELDLTGSYTAHPDRVYEVLSKLPNVQVLNYSCNSVKKMERLAALPYLTSLDLSANAIVDPYKIDTAYLVSVMSPRISDLSLRNHNHTCMKALSRAAFIVRLDLSANNIQDKGARDLANSMYSMDKLEHLNLGDNSIGPDGIVPICATIKKLKNRLKSLDLFRNPITDKGVINGVVYITVESLSLRGARIGPSGAQAIADANMSLHNLDIGSNDLGADGVEHILQFGCNNIHHLRIDNNNVRRQVNKTSSADAIQNLVIDTSAGPIPGNWANIQVQGLYTTFSKIKCQP